MRHLIAFKFYVHPPPATGKGVKASVNKLFLINQRTNDDRTSIEKLKGNERRRR